ncbi:MAG: N-acetyl-gamma-glutamyl-phosphate reductase [candidate division Zixibacteria bacterium]|nr:N-acetyl-gamma-glutamyl-phosphate reductase [candidate division Zixibacteria bacterium]
MNKKSIAIIGATGYTGSELVRILINHPGVEIAAITSESHAGKRFSDIHPFFQGIADHTLIPSDQIDKAKPDLVFLALPHGVAMTFVKKFKDKPFKIIDLSGDFRLESPRVYEQWYNKKHIYPEGIQEAVFGIPELYLEDIKNARIVSNPGCYPTSAILGVAPLLSKNLIESRPIIIDSKSGVSGAGIKSKSANHFCNVNDNFKAYNLKRHRHTIEIQGILDSLSEKKTIVQFIPHLLPVDRGILSTIYTRPIESTSDEAVQNQYSDFYANAPFVRIRSSPPAIKDVRGTNFCDLYPVFDERTGMIITISVIDNLVKGAAGQAIQNMNIMFDLPQTEGLHLVPVNP